MKRKDEWHQTIKLQRAGVKDGEEYWNLEILATRDTLDDMIRLAYSQLRPAQVQPLMGSAQGQYREFFLRLLWSLHRAFGTPWKHTKIEDPRKVADLCHQSTPQCSDWCEIEAE